MLVTDDASSATTAICDYLTGQGYEVQSTQPESMLEAAATFQPHVLVCEWMVGGGLDAAASVRAVFEQVPHVAVVLVTGWPRQEFSPRLRGLPIQKILSKPTRLAEIEHAVEDAYRASLGRL